MKERCKCCGQEFDDVEYTECIDHLKNIFPHLVDKFSNVHECPTCFLSRTVGGIQLC